MWGLVISLCLSMVLQLILLFVSVFQKIDHAGTFQLMGTIFYMGGEISDGFQHMAVNVSIL